MEGEYNSNEISLARKRKGFKELVFKITKHQRVWLNEVLAILKENKRVDYREIWSRLESRIPQKFQPKIIDFHLINTTGEQITLLGVIAAQGNLQFLKLCNTVIDTTWEIIKANPKIETIQTATIAEMSGIESFDTGLALNLIYIYGRFWTRADYNENAFTVKAIHLTAEEQIFYQYKHFTRIEVGITEVLEREKKDKAFLTSNPNKQKADQNEKAQIQYYIGLNRLEELKAAANHNFDFIKLIRFCEELNDNFYRGNYFSTAMIGRAILDHVPPLFKMRNFDQVANNYGEKTEFKSFKKNMLHLNDSLKEIANAHLHTVIREKETLPNETQVDFRQDLDVLLSEIVRLTK